MHESAFGGFSAKRERERERRSSLRASFLRSSSSLERKNAKKNAHVCFIKKKEEEVCERVLFVSFRKECRSTRSPSPERGAFLRRKVASARVFYNERPSFFSPLIFLSKKKCSGKMRHKSSSSPLKRETTTTATPARAPKPKTRKEEDHPKNDDASVFFYFESR